MNKKQIPTLGRIVNYRLSAQDVAQIEDARRASRGAAPGVSTSGAQMHKGNPVHEGQTFPMVIVRVWNEHSVNGQVLLDGNDSLWVTSRGEGEDAGTFGWPKVVR